MVLVFNSIGGKIHLLIYFDLAQNNIKNCIHYIELSGNVNGNAVEHCYNQALNEIYRISTALLFCKFPPSNCPTMHTKHKCLQSMTYGHAQFGEKQKNIFLSLYEW